MGCRYFWKHPYDSLMEKLPFQDFCETDPFRQVELIFRQQKQDHPVPQNVRGVKDDAGKLRMLVQQASRMQCVSGASKFQGRM